MAIYVTKKCPHCGYKYQIHESGDQRKYGCPLQTCMRCRKSYWDTDIKEPALYGYKNFHETKESIKRGIVLIIYSLFAVLFFVLGIWSIMEEEISASVIFFIFFAGIIWILYSYFAQKVRAKKHREEIIVQQQRDFDASKQRLENNDYLTALAERDHLAKKLLSERMSGAVEHYATRPE